MKNILLGSVLLCLLINQASAEEFDARVIAVMDGDTVMVLHNGQKIKIRMANIDAPESDQAFGRESRQALVGRVMKKQVHVNSTARDSYGRMIAEISVDGKSVNEAQVRDGMAWEYSHFHRNQRYLALGQQARQAQRGLWAGGNPVRPELWRKSHPAKPHEAKAVPTRTAAAAQANVACGKKHLCSQMLSCEEAKVYMLQCGVKTLDGNGDGVPCESLCVALPPK